MEQKRTTPSADGYYMPAEYEPHKGCIMIWPQRPGSWKKDAKDAEQAFCAVMEAITKSEPVYLAAGKKVLARAEAFAAQQKEKYREAIACGRHFPVSVFEAETDDAWARDMAPTFVRKGENVRAVNWSFNAWGGTVDGLYASWKLDDAFALDFAKREGYFCYDAAPFVLEGGSIHSHGDGSLSAQQRQESAAFKRTD